METTRTTPTPAEATTRDEAEEAAEVEAETGAAGEMPCPVCGHPMPDLKGGKDSICPVCGFKDSCCY